MPPPPQNDWRSGINQLIQNERMNNQVASKNSPDTSQQAPIDSNNNNPQMFTDTNNNNNNPPSPAANPNINQQQPPQPNNLDPNHPQPSSSTSTVQSINLQPQPTNLNNTQVAIQNNTSSASNGFKTAVIMELPKSVSVRSGTFIGSDGALVNTSFVNFVCILLAVMTGPFLIK
ncbi:hypothetical protein K502DRAFT_327307 [Neoconidiobolus thromboides FSU 785]|nr:hypothetical protein K502DRAFT_327307 [Neoconidiobolus thromboides FSU 785]